MLYTKKSQNFLYAQKLIKLTYITNPIVIFSIKLAKNFGLGLKTLQLSDNHKNWLSKYMVVIALLKE